MATIAHGFFQRAALLAAAATATLLVGFATPADAAPSGTAKHSSTTVDGATSAPAPVIEWPW
jgi:hypothetical protein